MEIVSETLILPCLKEMVVEHNILHLRKPHNHIKPREIFVENFEENKQKPLPCKDRLVEDLKLIEVLNCNCEVRPSLLCIFEERSLRKKELHWVDLTEIKYARPRCIFTDFIRTIFIFHNTKYNDLVRCSDAIIGDPNIVTRCIPKNYVQWRSEAIEQFCQTGLTKLSARKREKRKRHIQAFIEESICKLSEIQNRSPEEILGARETFREIRDEIARIHAKCIA